MEKLDILSNVTMAGRFQILTDINGKSASALLVFFLLCVCVPVFFLTSVLDLNAFERQNKAEGLGMAMDQGSGTVFKWKEKKSITVNPCHSRRASCAIHGL